VKSDGGFIDRKPAEGRIAVEAKPNEVEGLHPLPQTPPPGIHRARARDEHRSRAHARTMNRWPRKPAEGRRSEAKPSEAEN
jgi:hypothetical protein